MTKNKRVIFLRCLLFRLRCGKCLASFSRSFLRRSLCLSVKCSSTITSSDTPITPKYCRFSACGRLSATEAYVGHHHQINKQQQRQAHVDFLVFIVG